MLEKSEGAGPNVDVASRRGFGLPVKQTEWRLNGDLAFVPRLWAAEWMPAKMPEKRAIALGVEAAWCRALTGRSNGQVKRAIVQTGHCQVTYRQASWGRAYSS